MVTDMGKAEGVWDAMEGGRRRKPKGGNGEKRRSYTNILPPSANVTDQPKVHIEIKTRSDEEQNEHEGVENRERTSSEEKKLGDDGEAVQTFHSELVAVKGVPPLTKQNNVKTSQRETAANLAKQHKELKNAAKAARNDVRDINSPVKRLESGGIASYASKCPFSLHEVEMVDKYHAQMKVIEGQEKKCSEVAQQYLERLARKDFIKEVLSQRRRKIAEWAGEQWDSIICHAEEVEQETSSLKDQVAIIRHQHKLRGDHEKACTQATIRTLQKFTMLESHVSRVNARGKKEAGFISLHEEVSRRQEDWASEKEDRRKLEMKARVKIMAKCRQDKKERHQQHLQVS